MPPLQPQARPKLNRDAHSLVGAATKKAKTTTNTSQARATAYNRSPPTAWFRLILRENSHKRDKMILEEQRYLHEDLERLEQGVADRLEEEPKMVLRHGLHSSTQLGRLTFFAQIRDRLNRDHEVAQLLDQVRKQSAEIISLYLDESGERSKEIQQINTGDPFEEFYRQVNEIKNHHARYPNEQAENSELRYRLKGAEDGAEPMPSLVDAMFSGEEAFGRFFDLHASYESYTNLPNTKRLTYLQYLDTFDKFAPGTGGLRRADKLTETYFQYVGELILYLESFMRRTRPLENVDKILAEFSTEFNEAWEKGEVPGWQEEKTTSNGGDVTPQLSTAEAVWCKDCSKEFKNANVYKGHLSGRKHLKAAEQRAQSTAPSANGDTAGSHETSLTVGLKERAVASREDRIMRLTKAMSSEREDTRVNCERRQGMTERERQQELENLFSTSADAAQAQEAEDSDGEDGEDKILNPLKLPLGWDGKPIPFWLYRLHGLGQELPCEICANFVYMGRRAFEKHFNETRHIYGLKCLGIQSNSALFRDITSIEEALKLWEKIQRDKKRNKIDDGSVVQMEDAEGHVMPEKVYYDLQKQGLL